MSDWQYRSYCSTGVDIFSSFLLLYITELPNNCMEIDFHIVADERNPVYHDKPGKEGIQMPFDWKKTTPKPEK